MPVVVERHEALDVIPDLGVLGVEDMRPVRFVDDAAERARADEPASLLTALMDLYRPAALGELMGHSAAGEASADDQRAFR